MSKAHSALPRLDTRRAHERAHLTRLQYAHERALEGHIAKVLDGIGRRAAHGYVLDRQHGTMAALDNVSSEINRILRPSLISTARAFAERLQSHPKAAHAFEIKAIKAFEDLDRAIIDFMDEHTAEAVVGIAETTRTQILNAIRRGRDEDLSVEEIARLIVEQTAGDIGLARARRIARTETHAAAMYGQQAAAEASPLAFTKTWLATEDARTRPDHAEANGQTVALNEAFTVGDDHLAYPGDVSAPASQIINCRCVALYEPVLNQEQPA